MKTISRIFLTNGRMNLVKTVWQLSTFLLVVVACQKDCSNLVSLSVKFRKQGIYETNYQIIFKFAGVSYTKWAIEYEQPAGEAFSENHLETLMFVDNCNVILRQAFAV